MTEELTPPNADATWNSVAPGIEKRLLRAHADGGGTYVLRFPFAANTRFPAHAHLGGEDLYVLSGQVTVGQRTLSAGDFLWTPLGGVNSVYAVRDSELLVVAPRGVELQEGHER